MAVTTKPAAAGATELGASRALGKVGHYRWTICALLFFATTINYIDRQVLGILGPTLSRDIGWNVGAIITPIVVPWITLTWGWRAAFITTGALGFIWLAFWLAIYRPPQEHPKSGEAELAHICSDGDEAPRPVKWMRLLRHRQTWAFAIGKLMTDPIWWFYLYWLPKFLDTKYGIKLGSIA